MPEALVIDAVRTPRGTGKVGKGAPTLSIPTIRPRSCSGGLVDCNRLDIAELARRLCRRGLVIMRTAGGMAPALIAERLWIVGDAAVAEIAAPHGDARRQQA